MKELFPLRTFHQDAVVSRLNVLYKLLKDVNVEYDSVSGDASFELDGDVTITGDLTITGSLTGAETQIANAVNDYFELHPVDASFIDFSNTDLVSKTLYQSNYNWESGEITLNNNWLNGLTATASFIKFAQVNRELEIIVSLTLTNDTESPISTESAINIISAVTIPSYISSKIYRKDGTTCNQAPAGANDTVIPIKYLAIKNDNTNPRDIYGNIYSNVNSLGLGMHGNIVVPAGESHYLDFRVSILL